MALNSECWKCDGAGFCKAVFTCRCRDTWECYGGSHPCWTKTCYRGRYADSDNSRCKDCNGTGDCSECDGDGRTFCSESSDESDESEGSFEDRQDCYRCNGKGGCGEVSYHDNGECDGESDDGYQSWTDTCRRGEIIRTGLSYPFEDGGLCKTCRGTSKCCDCGGRGWKFTEVESDS